MKSRIFLVVALIVSFASSALAQQVNSCNGIACSGHGQCIVIRGEPACACGDGFISDAAGLNCVSTAPAVVAPNPTPAPAPSPTPAPQPEPVPVVAAPAPQPSPAQVVTPALVPPRPDRMLRLRLNTPFLSERERPYRDLRVVGQAYAYAGLPLIMVGVVNDFTGFMSFDAELAVSCIGAVLSLTGAVLILIGFLRQRHIRRTVLSGQEAHNNVLRMDAEL
jgi:hypothetical protein